MFLNKKNYAIDSLGGFMGRTHALITIFIFQVMLLIGVGFASGYLKFIQSSFILFFVAFMTVVGASMLVDLDGPESSAKYQLGLFGSALQIFMSVVASVFWGLTKRSGDKPPKSMHRLFWHTPIVAILIIVYYSFIFNGSNNSFANEFKVFKANGNLLELFVIKLPMVVITIFIAACCIYMGYNMITYKLFKLLGQYKIKDISSLIVTVISVIYMVSQPMSVLRYIGISIGIGWAAHIFEDLFTQGSVPLIWPIPNFKKKQGWWRPWILGKFQIYTGGVVNTVIDLVFFLLDLWLAYLIFIAK